jgi:hypothetical protein
MAQYYENAYVSICASAASCSSEGFLAPRNHNPYFQGPFELPHLRNGTENPEGSVKLAQYRQYSKELEPVTSRAWIMQESLLAPRMLSYSCQSVVWSCRRANHSDGGPSTAWYDWNDRRMWVELQGQEDLDACLVRWMRLVESYTSRYVSNASDRLPAISGIAQKFSRLRHKCLDFESNLRRRHSAWTDEEGNTACIEYTAGLWYCKIPPKVSNRKLLNPSNGPAKAIARKFLDQLLWSTSYHTTHRKHSYSTVRTQIPTYPVETVQAPHSLPPTSYQSYLAPTWSWAASNLFVAFEPINKYASIDALVVDCTTTVEESDAQYGNCLSGKLTVNSILIPINHGPHSKDLQKTWSFTFRPDTMRSNRLLGQITRGEREGWVLQLTGEGGPLSTEPKPYISSWTSYMAKGLLVVADGEDYLRIGLCSIEGRSVDSSRWGRLGAFDIYGERKTITII